MRLHHNFYVLLSIKYSEVSNIRGGSNKRYVDWNFCPNLISGYDLVGSNNGQEDGKKLTCVGEKTKRLELINGEAQVTAGRMENFLKRYTLLFEIYEHISNLSGYPLINSLQIVM